MTKEEIFLFIQKELEEYPEVSSKDISQKGSIPIMIVEKFRYMLEKTGRR